MILINIGKAFRACGPYSFIFAEIFNNIPYFILVQ